MVVEGGAGLVAGGEGSVTFMQDLVLLIGGSLVLASRSLHSFLSYGADHVKRLGC